MSSSNNGNYILTEQGTDKYADLDMAQKVALASVAQALVTTLRDRRNNGSHKDNEEALNHHDDEK